MKVERFAKTWLFALLFIIIISAAQAFACDIDFKILGDEKEVYDIGDEVVVLLVVKYTDRECPEGIDATQYKTDGLKIAGATKWKETSPDTWKRKLKLIVESNEKGKPTIAAVRTCEKEGGFGEYKCAAGQIKITSNEPQQAETN
ncbi:MAG: hypothetical protein GY839_16085 [candidate division Zixibacteria bacterium]|nr:hypothetical protein [candidate division Zixibacteria bacterium]